MAQDNEVLIKISADLKEALNALEQFQKAADKSAKTTQKSFDGLSKTLSGIGSSITAGIAAIGASKAFNAVVSGFEKIVDAGLDAERSSVRFNSALRLAGDVTEKAAKQLEQFAKAQSALSGLDDDLIKDQIAFAKNLGLTNDQTTKAIEAAINLSAATGKDLNTAVSAVSKSMLGYNRELGALIPQTKGFTDAQAKAGQAVEFVSNRFAGAAAGFAQTLPGAIQQLNTNFGNLLETLGQLAIKNPVIIKAINEVASLFVKLTNVVEANEETIVRISIAISKFLVESLRFASNVILNFIAGVDFFSAKLVNIYNGIKAFGEAIIEVFKLSFQFIIDSAKSFATTVVKILLGPLGTIVQAYEALNFAKSEAFKSSADQIKKLNDEANKARDDRDAELKDRIELYAGIKDEVNASADAIKNIGKLKAPEIKVQANIEKLTIPKGEDKKATVEIEARIKDLIKNLKDVGLNQFEKIERDLADKRLLIEKGFALKIIKTAEERNKLLSKVEEQALEQREALIKKIYDDSAKSIGDGLRNVFEALKEDDRGTFGTIITGFEEAAATSRDKIAAVFGNRKLEAAIAGTISSAITALSKGAAGAKEAFIGIATSLASAFLGPIGQAFGPLLQLLSQSADELRQTIKSFFEALPTLIQTIIENIPVLIEAIVEQLPIIVERLAEILPEAIMNAIMGLIENLDEIITQVALKLPIALTQGAIQFITKMPQAAVTFAISLVKEAPKIAEGFAKEFINQVPKIIDQFLKGIADGVAGAVKGAFGGALTGILGVGTGGGGSIGGLLGTALGGLTFGATAAIASGARKIFKFADGGLIPEGFPGDTFPARLTSGEFVIDRSQNRQLQNFLDRAERGGGLGEILDQIREGQNQNLTINLVIGEDQLANAIVNLDRRGFRLRS